MRSYLLLFFVLISTSIFAEDYRIFSFEQNVLVKKENSRWIKARTRLSLNDSDSIKIETKSKVKLLEEETGRTFEWDKQGVFEVRDIIVESLKRDSNWLNRLFSTIINNAYSNPIKIWYSIGETRRGNNDDQLEQVLAYALKRQCYNEDDYSSSALQLNIHNISKSEFYFDIVNNSDCLMYVNVLKFDMEHKRFSVLYYIRDGNEWMVLPVENKSKLHLSEIVFTRNSKMKYVVFGTKKPIKIKYLEERLTSEIIEEQLIINDDIVIGTEL